MEGKRFEVCVQRMNRIQTFAVCMVVILVAYGLSALLENTAGIVIKGEIILLLLIVLICFLLTKYERFFPATERLVARFSKDEVTFIKGKDKKGILQGYKRSRKDDDYQPISFRQRIFPCEDKSKRRYICDVFRRRFQCKIGF